MEGSSAFQFVRVAYKAGLVSRRRLAADAWANLLFRLRGSTDAATTELRERKARYGVLGVCVGSGQGVAMVLEAARLLAREKPRRTVRAVLFMNEENGLDVTEHGEAGLHSHLRPPDTARAADRQETTA